ncbi:regulator of chromosome condensation domain-containing protein [Heterostelium album PN500]|uniref:Regulator of chromosome condensation domain-containing protein n=1 Tax=Heterostelium pallidum (strain ATCC 26659 / Pp 5 / PN500) TaxID=670386 RepID=D3AXI7_HETP5|nr:regulator of chromosome condensation domain-containing protein [Heterostelium album PN500]EFA86256.1 regulator of chromosome condensation domain-containing protein [Heterostelium album PN500]|eukprot:XP_020438361.1 regulator of chromosome condensation domain-containing protein [Heterostelium album PN500]
MTYLAGLFCLHWKPYECFVAFANMVHTHYFTSLFMMDVNQIVKHIKIFDILYQRYLPELHSQFRKLGFSSEHYLLEWFLTLFTKQLPLDVVARIWDCYVFEGESFIYATAIAILKCCQKLIISSSFDEAALLLRTLPQDIKEEALFSAINTIHIPKYFKKLVENLNKESYIHNI